MTNSHNTDPQRIAEILYSDILSLDGDERSKASDKLVISIRGKGGKATGRCTVSLTNVRIFDQYLRYLEEYNYSRDSITMYRSMVRMFLLHLCLKHFVDVDKEYLKDYFNKTLKPKGLSNNSLQHHYSALDSLYRFLSDELGLISINPVWQIKKTLRSFKSSGPKPERQVINVEEAALLVNAAFSTRDKAIILLALKTGLRRKEICSLNMSGVNLKKRYIRIPPTPKRSYNYCFIDDELLSVLNRWIARREAMLQSSRKKTDALFITPRGNRLTPDRLGRMVRHIATELGLHDPDADDLIEKFTPHCCRYFFTTHLRKSGMPKEFRQKLRGDKPRDAEAGYDRITMEELKEAYFRYVPQLGVS
jgi:integrase/recombinase XerD